MRVYFDGGWTLERDDGSKIELTWSESRLLYEQMLRDAVWDEVEMRLPDDDDELQEDFGCSREDLEDAKEIIIDELLPHFQNLSRDLVFDAVHRFC